ncbi:MAG: hypothetical protein WCC04_20835 [Terriglobales bacterium]
MILIASDVESLKSALGCWEWFEYIATAIVWIGCAGEYVAEFTSLAKSEESKKKLARLSLIVLIVGIAGELLGTVRTSQLSGQLIVNIEHDVETAKTEMAKQQERAALAERATLDLQKSVAWRTVNEEQAVIIVKQLAGKNVRGDFVAWNWDDPEQMQYFMHINNVCLRINIVCVLHRMKNPYPSPVPLPGLFSFAYEDADQTFINALKAAGLVTGRVGTYVGSTVFPDSIREGIIIGPKPNPLNPEVWPETPSPNP